MSVPVMSPGIRSGVNWMRLNERSSASATVWTISVLASPGTPISSAVATGQQRGENPFDHFVLAHDPAGDLGPEGANRLGEAGELLDIVGDWCGGRHAGPGR